jgi:hypothetical protein
MAKRPVFVPVRDVQGQQLVKEREVEFKWHPGMAPSQKKKNIKEIHSSAEKEGLFPILEISTKSEDLLGKSLSAFNLKVFNLQHGFISLESAFQGSKVFKNGGPYVDLYGMNGGEIKKDERLRNSGGLVKFQYDGNGWALEPKTAFYDWLYINAVHEKLKNHSAFFKYNGFTDIEFNPKKSINCQARSCALYVALSERGLLNKVLSSKQLFLDILENDSFYQPHSAEKRQGTFFD